jgi:ATP-dependent exoDNAse (exonuclease V) alpha subunit
MLAVRRVDVTLLNDAVREWLVDAGRLGRDAVVAGAGELAREYRAGDLVLVRANDHRRGLLNGSRAQVEGVDPDGATLSLRTDDDRQLTVPAGWAAGHLDHGYAMTCHKAQGLTVDEALLYGAGGVTREAGYVGLSRGRVANHLYVVEPDDQEQSVAAGDGLDRIAARLAVRRTQTLATRQLPRRTAGGWRRSTTIDTTVHRTEGIAR